MKKARKDEVNTDKEKQVFKELKEKKFDIQLIFLKYLLGREVTVDAMGDFALQYIELGEDEKRDVAQELNRDCIRGLDIWFRWH